MRKMRKGFTLVELMIVIGIISILGAMAMIGGSEATDTAKATRIIEEFEKISSAMMMYYADNYGSVDSGDVIDADDIVEAVQAYIKKTDKNLVVSDTAAVGKYFVEVGDAIPYSWYLTYKLPADDTKVGAILKTKSERYGLMKTKDATTNDYDGTATIVMKVR